MCVCVFFFFCRNVSLFSYWYHFFLKFGDSLIVSLQAPSLFSALCVHSYLFLVHFLRRCFHLREPLELRNEMIDVFILFFLKKNHIELSVENLHSHSIWSYNYSSTTSLRLIQHRFRHSHCHCDYIPGDANGHRSRAARTLVYTAVHPTPSQK